MLQILPRVAPQKTLTCAATWSIHVILFHLGMIVALGAFLWTLETLARLGVTCHVDRVTAILSLFGLSRTPTDPEDGWTKRKRQHGQCRRCWRRWRRWRRLEWWLYGQWLPWLRHDGLSLRWHGLWLRHGLPMRWHGLSLWRHDDADDANDATEWQGEKGNLYSSPKSVATLGVLTVVVKAQCSVEVFSHVCHVGPFFWWPLQHKSSSSSVFDCSLARNGGSETSLPKVWFY